MTPLLRLCYKIYLDEEITKADFQAEVVVLRRTAIGHCVDAFSRSVICSLPPIPIKHNKLSQTNIRLSGGTASPAGSQLD